MQSQLRFLATNPTRSVSRATFPARRRLTMRRFRGGFAASTLIARRPVSACRMSLEDIFGASSGQRNHSIVTFSEPTQTVSPVLSEVTRLSRTGPRLQVFPTTGRGKRVSYGSARRCQPLGRGKNSRAACLSADPTRAPASSGFPPSSERQPWLVGSGGHFPVPRAPGCVACCRWRFRECRIRTRITTTT